MISQVYYTRSGKWCFQYVSGFFRVYSSDGKYTTEFRSFREMSDFIARNDVYKEDGAK